MEIQMLTVTALKASLPKHLPAPNSDLSRPCPWATPSLVEICIGLEINGYLPAEF